MNAKWLFAGVALVLLTFAPGASADEGKYEKTQDGKTMIWNSHPAAGESAEWSGERDKDGYATGPGTITWYGTRHSGYTFVKKNHLSVIGRYSGTMVKGKFEGVVVKLGTGPKIGWQPMAKDTHATFVHGNQTSEWTPGGGDAAAAPSPTPRPAAKEKVSAPAKEG